MSTLCRKLSPWPRGRAGGESEHGPGSCPAGRVLSFSQRVTRPAPEPGQHLSGALTPRGRSASAVTAANPSRIDLPLLTDISKGTGGQEKTLGRETWGKAGWELSRLWHSASCQPMGREHIHVLSPSPAPDVKQVTAWVEDSTKGEQRSCGVFGPALTQMMKAL